MEQPYSVLADWLSRFHTWPEFIQALWLVAVPVTVLGGRGEATLHGVRAEWNGPPLSHRGGRLRSAGGEAPALPPPNAAPVIPRSRSGATLAPE